MPELIEVPRAHPEVENEGLRWYEQMISGKPHAYVFCPFGHRLDVNEWQVNSDGRVVHKEKKTLILKCSPDGDACPFKGELKLLGWNPNRARKK